jgi:hypothetical protein
MTNRDITADALRRQSEAARDLIAALAGDDAELAHDMAEGETSLFEAIDKAIMEMDDCEIMITGCAWREGQIAERRARAQKRVERLRGLIEQAMLVAGLNMVKRPVATITVAQVKPKPIVFDEALIPAEYWKQPDPVLNKAKINEDVKDGAEIEGVTMSNGGTTLTIRRA